jgi:nucleoid-associated protein YgaU
MARETKVGLLAGLAFIICFAIILANRGRQDPIVRSTPTLADRSVNTPQIGQGIPIQAPVHPTNTPLPGDAAPSPHQSLGARLNPVRKDLAPPTNQSMVDANPRNSERSLVPRRSRTADSTPGARDLTRSTTPAGNPELISPSTEQLQRQAILQERLDAITTGDDQQRDAQRRAIRPARVTSKSIEQSPIARPKSAMPSRSYKVKPGDTLTSIAKQHYGRSTGAVVNAIYQANRSNLTSPDDLRVNVELVLPEIEGAASQSIVSGGTRSASHAISKSSSSKSPAAGFKWYQIKKNDRYVSIARDQLGDGDRWREIYELNKDKFPDPQRIRHGVRIKLPTKNASAAGR